MVGFNHFSFWISQHLLKFTISKFKNWVTNLQLNLSKSNLFKIIHSGKITRLNKLALCCSLLNMRTLSKPRNLLITYFFCLLSCSHLNMKEWAWLNIDISSLPMKLFQPIRCITEANEKPVRCYVADERPVRFYIGCHLSYNIIMPGLTEWIQENLCLSSLFLS